MLTDCLAVFAGNPLRPAYREDWRGAGGGQRAGAAHGSPSPAASSPSAMTVRALPIDNEGPRHDQLIRPFRLADRLVTNGEWLEFMADGGYANRCCGSPTAGRRSIARAGRRRSIGSSATARGIR